MKLNTAPVTTSQPPHVTTCARRTLVRGARARHTSATTMPASAAGASHDHCVPHTPSNRRVMPVWPHMPACPVEMVVLPVPEPPATTAPSMEPVMRPRPL